jgi:hypothetical protein
VLGLYCAVASAPSEDVNVINAIVNITTDPFVFLCLHSLPQCTDQLYQL